MINTIRVIFCDNEHGTGDVAFPDLTSLGGFEFREMLIKGNTITAVRKAAKQVGWSRVQGLDYCPDCTALENDRHFSASK